MLRLSREAYTVGWLCALPLSELVAAMKMLDDEHEPLNLEIEDENTYVYGSINKHNVVIACMPPGQPGKVSAARLIQPLSHSFPNMRIHLFVGIGGGVPQSVVLQDPERDIHLGDVVVGWPDLTGAPAVVQYDLIERQGDDVEMQRLLSTSEKPDRKLLSALGLLMAKHVGGRKHFSQHLQKLNDLVDFKYPGVERDKLYASTSPHIAGPTCEKCSPDHVILRESRKLPAQPKFHQGTILCGDSVMKDARKRDELSAKYFNAICFEMEAAGVIDQKHCLVIRGISDYCDGHKNGSWQSYAAATAAAFAREFLYTIQPSTVRELPHVAETAVVAGNTNFNASNDILAHQLSLYASQPSPPDGRIGLKTISCPQIKTADLVFVHGLTGNRETTWTHDYTNFFWPYTITEDIRSACVTTFGYKTDQSIFVGKSDSSAVLDCARNLLESLLQHRKSHEDVPLMFIAHGIGGHICEQALLLCKESLELRKLRSSTCAIMFFDTPHSGDILAQPKLAFEKYFTGLPMNAKESISESLPSSSDLFQRLESEFKQLLQHTHGQIKIFDWPSLEEQRTSATNVTDLVSTRQSVTTQFKHADAAKCSNKQDKGYDFALRNIRKRMYEMPQSVAGILDT
ncbi:uncharacterized protein PAC_01366 [Phialocephala subalpina]|uniref:Uncharacterized protein n=1 Tax=Phialocephala subalpina TaxID=576137 RepID=A0A1L7WFD2_9HELO|nr:uncharacterized protein PAC_01366 [Phialocephala subalpina]